MQITADVAQPGDVVLALEGVDEGGVFIYRDSTVTGSAGTPEWFTAGVAGVVSAPNGVLALLVRNNAQYCCTPDPEPVTPQI